MSDNGRSRMVAQWNHEEADFDRWAKTPAGQQHVAKLRAFFERESKFHEPAEFDEMRTPNGTPYRVYRVRSCQEVKS